LIGCTTSRDAILRWRIGSTFRPSR
jgi:hypothetical protein